MECGAVVNGGMAPVGAVDLRQSSWALHAGGSVIGQRSHPVGESGEVA